MQYTVKASAWNWGDEPRHEEQTFTVEAATPRAARRIANRLTKAWREDARASVEPPANETDSWWITRLPFPGFYESLYSSELDREEESWIEYEAEERQAENGIPEELRLDADELSEIIWRHRHYDIGCKRIARAYVDAFSIWLDETLGVDAPSGEGVCLRYESMDSPREYNFTTDRVYAHIRPAVVRYLFKLSAREGHTRLAQRIRESFTSRSGFISGYSNDLDAWLEKPLADWDHNELCTLIEAVSGFREDDDADMTLFYAVSEGEEFYHAFEDSIDWPAFETAMNEARDEKAEALKAENPDYVPPVPRCDQTPTCSSEESRHVPRI